MERFDAVIGLAKTFAKELIRKTGVQTWEEPEVSDKIAYTAWRMAAWIVYYAEGTNMALPDVLRVQTGTAKTFASAGGDAAITLASVANNAARQSVKLDLGATRGPRYSVEVHMEFAATPTAGNALELWWAPSPNATAGTDNPGGVSGTDAAYAGYSSNLDASVKQLQLIGAMTVTAQVTATVQKQTLPQFFEPLHRYGSLVVYNKSGAAIHSSDTNCKVVLRPQEDVLEET